MADLIAKLIAWALSLRPVRVWFHYLERRGFSHEVVRKIDRELFPR